MLACHAVMRSIFYEDVEFCTGLQSAHTACVLYVEVWELKRYFTPPSEDQKKKKQHRRPDVKMFVVPMS